MSFEWDSIIWIFLGISVGLNVMFIYAWWKANQDFLDLVNRQMDQNKNEMKAIERMIDDMRFHEGQEP